MNGDRADNSAVFGGEADLRDPERMCNFCRELSAFRLFERIGRLNDTATSYATWQTQYRVPFYDAYGFDVPPNVPMETPPGRPSSFPASSPEPAPSTSATEVTPFLERPRRSRRRRGRARTRAPSPASRRRIRRPLTRAALRTARSNPDGSHRVAASGAARRIWTGPISVRTTAHPPFERWRITRGS